MFSRSGSNSIEEKTQWIDREASLHAAAHSENALEKIEPRISTDLKRFSFDRDAEHSIWHATKSMLAGNRVARSVARISFVPRNVTV